MSYGEGVGLNKFVLLLTPFRICKPRHQVLDNFFCLWFSLYVDTAFFLAVHLLYDDSLFFNYYYYFTCSKSNLKWNENEKSYLTVRGPPLLLSGPDHMVRPAHACGVSGLMERRCPLPSCPCSAPELQTGPIHRRHHRLCCLSARLHVAVWHKEARCLWQMRNTLSWIR